MNEAIILGVVALLIHLYYVVWRYIVCIYRYRRLLIFVFVIMLYGRVNIFSLLRPFKGYFHFRCMTPTLTIDSLSVYYASKRILLEFIDRFFMSISGHEILIYALIGESFSLCLW